tara:strand:+ start:290 stop:775 length:486 start_codon:yes stop_codon:yes gene_type:complete
LDGLQGGPWNRPPFSFHAEYRYPFWDIGINNGVDKGLAGDIVLFMDKGMVFHSFSNDAKYNNLSTNYGFGIRFRRKTSDMGRGMIAHSKETTRTHRLVYNKFGGPDKKLLNSKNNGISHMTDGTTTMPPSPESLDKIDALCGDKEIPGDRLFYLKIDMHRP